MPALVFIGGPKARDEASGPQSQYENHHIQGHGVIMVQEIGAEDHADETRAGIRRDEREDNVEADGDVERVSYHIVVGGVRFVAVVRGEEEGGEGGVAFRYDAAGEQRDIDAGGGSEGWEVQDQEERLYGEAAGGGEWTEGETGDCGGDIRDDAVVSGGGGEEGQW